MKIQLLFEPRDLWLGVYWDIRYRVYQSELYVYLCLLPMLPLKITTPYQKWDEGSAEVEIPNGWRRSLVFLLAYCCGVLEAWPKTTGYPVEANEARFWGFDFCSEASAEHFAFLLRAAGFKAKVTAWYPF